MTEQEKKQAKKLLTFANDKHLAFFDEVQEANETLKEIAKKEISIPPVELQIKFPDLKFPEVQTVKIEGVQLIKGDKGDPGKNGISPDKDEIIQTVLSLTPKPKKGDDGYTPLKGKDYFDGEAGSPGKDGSPDTPEQIREKLESLKGEARLDKESIRGLEDEINGLKAVISNIPRGRAMGRAKSQITRRVDLTSQVDGTTRSFTLPRDTLAVLGVQGSQFPFTMADVDFTLAGNVMTLGDQVATPVAGQTLVVLLDVLFYP